MSIHPPSNFWNTYDNIILSGVNAGADPLYITGTTMHIKTASMTDSGAVTTGAQEFAGAKKFNTTLALADSYTVSATSNDTTLAGDRTTALVTEHAVKTYCDTHSAPTLVPYAVATGDAVGAITSSARYVIDNSDANASKFKIYSPDGTKLMQVAVDQLWNVGQLYSTAATVELWGNAGKKMSLSATDIHNYITTDSTSSVTGSMIEDGGIGVAKNAFVGGLLCSNTALTLRTTGTAYINSDGASLDLLLHTGASPVNIANTSTIYFNNPASGKHLDLHAADAASMRMYLGAAALAFTITPTKVESYMHTAVTSAAANQFSVCYNVANYTDFSVSATGDLTVNATGNDINFHSTDAVHVLNTTDATSKTTGALQVSGGVGIAGDVYCDQMNCLSKTVPQVHIQWDASNYGDISVDDHGLLTVATTGGEIDTERHSVVHILNEDDATNLTDGSVNTLGGISVTKSIQGGADITAVGVVKAARLFGENLVNQQTLYIADKSPPTGTASIAIVTGGHTNIATSGTLYNNSNPVMYSITSTEGITLTGAFVGYFTIVLVKHGTVVTARFSDTRDTATSTSEIIANLNISAPYRPSATFYHPIIVYYASAIDNPLRTRRGTLSCTSAGTITIYSSDDILDGQWPTGYSSGFKNFCSTWTTN